MRYFDYFIKCIIRNFVRLFIKPICIVIVVFLVFVLFMFVDSVFAIDSFAVEGLASRVWNDYAFNGDTVIQYNGLHGRACYIPPNLKGVIDLRFSSSELHYGFFKGNEHLDSAVEPGVGSVAINTYYANSNGLIPFDTTNAPLNEYGGFLCFYSVDYTGYEDIPVYQSVQDYSNAGIIDSQQQTTNAINQQTNVIQQQTTAINQQTNSINNINNSILDDNIDDSSMDIDVSSLSFEDEQGIDNFFTTLINSIKSAYDSIDSSVETIEIPLPYTTQKLVLTSDLVSKHIINTPLYNYIQIFWYFLIGSYIVIFCRRIIVWLTSGEIAERGPASFIRFLDKNNEIIKTYMM